MDSRLRGNDRKVEVFTMPFVTLTVRKPQTSAFKTTLLDAVHEALVSVGVPPTDKFQRVLALDEEDFRFDPSYPDAATPRGDDYAFIEILWSVGRSVKVKRKLLHTLMTQLSDQGIDPEHVTVVFKETQWENWAFSGGRLLHAEA
jgi:phenylpyruvate tautomerase PptA (4-oxalocrotonate tautomerase family)